MKIALINGSPRLGKSNSGFLLNALESLIHQEHKIFHYQTNHPPLPQEQVQALCQMDVLVFAFPLYVDGIPSHLLSLLVALEGHLKGRDAQEVLVYALVNNGFYEGKQTAHAIDILKNWCHKAGVKFGQGIGIGAGEILKDGSIPIGRGPLKNLERVLKELAENINQKTPGETRLINPNFPRFAWLFAGIQFWNQWAKKHGLKKKDLLRQPPAPMVEKGKVGVTPLEP